MKWQRNIYTNMTKKKEGTLFFSLKLIEISTAENVCIEYLLLTWWNEISTVSL